MANNMKAAREEMSKVVYAVWKRETALLFGQHKPMYFNSNPGAESEIDTMGVWAKVTIEHRQQYQSSLGDKTCSILFDRKGIISVQCFIPLSVANCFDVAEQLAVSIRDAMQNHRNGCVIFRKCAAEEGTREKACQGFNATANFEYSEIS